MPKKKAVAKPKPVAPPKPEELMAARLAEKYTERTGYKRRIAHLWNNYFRVDYLPYSPEDRIISDFIRVDEKDLKVFQR
jgi:hypothetical protein